MLLIRLPAPGVQKTITMSVRNVSAMNSWTFSGKNLSKDFILTLLIKTLI